MFSVLMDFQISKKCVKEERKTFPLYPNNTKIVPDFVYCLVVCVHVTFI